MQIVMLHCAHKRIAENFVTKDGKIFSKYKYHTNYVILTHQPPIPAFEYSDSILVMANSIDLFTNTCKEMACILTTLI